VKTRFFRFERVKKSAPKVLPKGLKERDANFITLSGPGYIYYNTRELGQVLLKKLDMIQVICLV
jgi:hypothetical protein